MSFKVGDRVRHKKFGKGTVYSVAKKINMMVNTIIFIQCAARVKVMHIGFFKIPMNF